MGELLEDAANVHPRMAAGDRMRARPLALVGDQPRALFRGEIVELRHDSMTLVLVEKRARRPRQKF